MLRPEHQIEKIVYCTARVRGRPNDPSQPMRQQFYLRALETIPCLVIYGRYVQRRKMMPVSAECRLTDEQGRPARFAEVIATEEKGSDVNLATHLLVDGFQDCYDAAVVVSADTDLAEPLRVVRSVLKKTMIVLSPYTHLSSHLAKYADAWKPITEAHVLASQFPDVLNDAKGSFHRPPQWR